MISNREKMIVPLSQLNVYAILILVVFGACCDGCSKAEKTGEMIRVSVATPTRKVVNYSEIADSISYIQLQCSDDKPIGEIKTLKTIDSLIVVLDQKNRQIMLFDKDGVFRNEIGSAGSGPGEYINCRQIDVDSERHHILVYDTAIRSVLRYDLENNYIGRDSIGVADDFTYLGNGNYLVANYEEEREDLAGIFYVTSYPFSAKKIRGCRDDIAMGKPFEFFDCDGSASIMTRSYEDKILYWHNDSLMTLVDFDIEQSPTGVQLEELKKNPLKRMELLDRVYFFNYHEFVLVYFWYGEEPRYLFYNKNNQKIDIVKGIVNDIDGIYGVRMPISINNSIVAIVDADENRDQMIQIVHLK